MVIFLAGLQAIDSMYIEAAKIDGANPWNVFYRIIIPFLAPAIMINVILNTIHGLKVFDIILSLTGGGPGNTTAVLSTAVFRTYSHGNYGLSTALGVVVFLITAVISVIFIKVLTPKETVL
jgi:raffinose/stachyose/melibiose transport system permease protein